MKLHEKPNEFLDAIQAASQSTGIREVFVEKDYWVTLLLYRLSQESDKNRIVFKGGTSLSKAYKVVKRFSEDVDLALLRDGLNNSQSEKIIERISKNLTSDPFKEVSQDGVTSKRGMSRRTLHEYPRNVQQTNFGIVRDKVLLEVNCFGKPTPFKGMQISSMIGEFLSSKKEDALIKEYGLQSFKVNILDWKVTFLEKVLSLTYASFADGDVPGKEVRERVRHFYDLATMFESDEIQRFLNSKEALVMLSEIRKDEKLQSRSQWVDRKLAESCLFKDLKKSLGQVEKYYERELLDLVFRADDLTEFRHVKKCLEEVSAMVEREEVKTPTVG